MNRVLVLILLLVSSMTVASESDCKCRGILLYGKVKVVEHHADIKIKFVDHFPEKKLSTKLRFFVYIFRT